MRWFVGSVVVLAALVGGVLAYAPYLPQLIAEGVPPLVGPGAGQFASLDGAVVPRDLRISADARDLPLEPALAEAFAGAHGKALLVFRRGALELEHYADGLGPETRFNSFSMAKSLVGALTYRALADGRISSLDQTLGELLPDDVGLKSVSLRALLEMKSGIAFDSDGGKFGSTQAGKDDTAPNPFGPLARLHFLGLAAIEPGLAVKPEESHPFSYQNVNTALLGAVLERVYDRPLVDLLDEMIWRPAGATTSLWRQPAAGTPVSAYCCIYATARDWIRVGLFLNENGGAAPFLPVPLWREFLGLDTGVDERHRAATAPISGRTSSTARARNCRGRSPT